MPDVDEMLRCAGDDAAELGVCPCNSDARAGWVRVKGGGVHRRERKEGGVITMVSGQNDIVVPRSSAAVALC